MGDTETHTLTPSDVLTIMDITRTTLAHGLMTRNQLQPTTNKGRASDMCIHLSHFGMIPKPAPTAWGRTPKTLTPCTTRVAMPHATPELEPKWVLLSAHAAAR